MKRFLLLFILLILGSCTKKAYVPRNIEKIEIQKFKIDQTNIRAIVTVSDKEVIYAGSKRFFCCWFYRNTFF